MNTRTRSRLLMTAVAAALPLAAFSLPAHAQTQVQQNGNALDANTRVGGTGEAPNRNPTYTGNQLVTRNVSGGKAFRGPINYTDPLEFRGPIASPQFDRFVRDSSNAPTRSNPSTNYATNNPTAFYGARRATPPPPGYRTESFSGGFFNTGAGQQTVGVGAMNPAYLGTSASYNSQTSMLRPSGVVLGQGVDKNTNEPQVLTASPLTGVMQMNAAAASGLTQPGTGLPGATSRNPADRGRLTPAEIEQMRQELNDAARQSGGADNTGQPPANDPNAISQPLTAQPLGSALANSAVEGTSNSRASAAAARNQNGTAPGANPNANANANGNANASANANTLNSQLNGGLQTGQGVQQFSAVPPEQQSSQYAALQQRFQQQLQAGAPLSPEEANMQQRLLQQAQNASEQPKPGEPGAAAPGQPGAAAAPGQPGQPGQPGEPGAAAPLPLGGRQGKARGPRAGGAKSPAAPEATKPGAPATPAGAIPDANEPPAAAPTPGAARPEPLKIKSLAEGVQAKGLHDQLLAAEQLMRQGKFTSAMQKYADAERVAPNNPLLRLGRAQAELGATRYGSAETHLREAVAADPALLMGKYDLEAFYGRDRLGHVVSDLQNVAKNEPSSPRAPLLLAYIAYGRPGQESAAADYLAEAAKRAGKPDSLIEAMRNTWALPASASAPAPEAEPNK
jgi:hypothetical protein